jgi:NADH-quinone oxidoreductase subunit M
MLAGIFCFIAGSERGAKTTAIIFSLLILVVSLSTLFFTNEAKYITYNNVNYLWLKYLGANYYVGIEGAGRMLTFLTALAYPLILIATAKNEFKKPASFYGLMMLSQAGIMGVFLALDALTFYFFWELALIPIYFLCSIWGGEKEYKQHLNSLFTLLLVHS